MFQSVKVRLVRFIRFVLQTQETVRGELCCWSASACKPKTLHSPLHGGGAAVGVRFPAPRPPWWSSKGLSSFHSSHLSSCQQQIDVFRFDPRPRDASIRQRSDTF